MKRFYSPALILISMLSSSLPALAADASTVIQCRDPSFLIVVKKSATRPSELTLVVNQRITPDRSYPLVTRRVAESPRGDDRDYLGFDVSLGVKTNSERKNLRGTRWIGPVGDFKILFDGDEVSDRMMVELKGIPCVPGDREFSDPEFRQ